MSNFNSSTERAITLLSDSPVGRDDFTREGARGPHERLASAIVDVLRSSESGGTMIGLAGDWGSGKSNIVKMVSSRLLNHGGDGSEFAIAEFDAWSHEGDPLRRTFLESLIANLIEKKWVEESKWTAEKNLLTKRVVETEQNTKSLPTLLGIFLSLAVSLIPFGAVLVTRTMAAGAEYVWDKSRPFSWTLFWGTLLATMPLSIAVLNGIWRVCKHNASLRMRGPKSLWTAENWAFTSHSSVINAKSRSFQSTDPTSVEFESKFSDLMSEALTPNKRRLLLTIDNLDRIDAKSALKIWSTLQTFLPRHGSGPDWTRRITVLVPYAPEGLRKLWDADSDDDRLAESFFDKSFQVRFEVPPPTLSSWERYLKRLLGESIPSLDESEKHDVYRVIDLCRNDGAIPRTDHDVIAEIRTSPTPRELKLIVNQLATLLKIWQFELPVRDLAYFVLVNRRARDLRASLVSGDIPGRSARQICGPELRQSLAASLFNVAPGHAMELLIGEEIQSALNAGNSGSLAQLAAEHVDGFWLVLENFATSKLVMSGVDVVSSSAQSYYRSGLSAANRQEHKAFVAALETAARTFVEISSASVDEGVLGGLGNLCELIGTADFVAYMSDLLHEPLADGDFEDDRKARLEALLVFLASVANAKHLEAVRTRFVIPYTAGNWQEGCDLLRTRGVTDEIIQKIGPACEISDLETTLAASAGSSWTVDISNCAQISARGFPEHQWKKLTQELATRFQTQTPQAKDEVARLIATILALAEKRKQSAIAKLTELAKQGYLLHQLELYWSIAEFQRDAIFAYLFFGPGAAKPEAESGNSSAGYAKLQAFLESEDASIALDLIERGFRHGDASFILRLGETTDPCPKLVVVGLKQAVEHERFREIFPPHELKRMWRFLAVQLGGTPGDYTRLLTRATEDEWLQDQLIAEGFKSENLGFYQDLMIRTNLPMTSKFTKWCREGLEGLSKEEWQQSYEGNFDAFRLLFALKDRGLGTIANVQYPDALVAHAQGVLQGTALPDLDLSARWQECLSFVETTGVRRNTQRRILEDARDAPEADGAIRDEWFDLYGVQLYDAEGLGAVSGIVDRLFVPLVRERHIRGLTWLNSLLDLWPNAIRDLGDDQTLENWNAHLISLWNSETDDGVREIMRRLADHSGVQLPAPANPDAEP